MTKKPTLPENYHRSLSVTAHMVEETLDKLENILRAKRVEKLTSRVTTSYSEEERQRLLHIISKMRKVNEEFVQLFALSQTESDEAHILGASITHLWTILVDSTAKGMKGFGPLAPHLAREVDKHVDRLLAVLDEF
jgi:hypothetical protein